MQLIKVPFQDQITINDIIRTILSKKFAYANWLQVSSTFFVGM